LDREARLGLAYLAIIIDGTFIHKQSDITNCSTAIRVQPVHGHCSSIIDILVSIFIVSGPRPHQQRRIEHEANNVGD